MRHVLLWEMAAFCLLQWRTMELTTRGEVTEKKGNSGKGVREPQKGNGKAEKSRKTRDEEGEGKRRQGRNERESGKGCLWPWE